MTRPGEALERVTVIEHSAFVKFYQDELEQEGLEIGVDDLDENPKPQTVTIFVDHRKDVKSLEISIPTVTDSVQTISTIEGVDFETIKSAFESKFKPLPVKEPRSASIHFEERTLYTDEIVSQIELDRGLLQMGATAISVYAREIEKVCRLQNSHSVLAPLIETFVQEVLFERPVNLYSGEVDHRMGDVDVAEHIRATFVPLIRSKTVQTQKRKKLQVGGQVSHWKNFQATATDRRPCIASGKTMFNLVPCGSPFEAEFSDFLEESGDVAAFIKNAGPQKLIVDYLSNAGRPAMYWPDFIVRLTNGSYLLVETKGQSDDTVALKAKAAVEWCKTASGSGVTWSYVFVSQHLFESNNEFSMEALARACVPRLKSLLDSLKEQQPELAFDQTPAEVRHERAEKFLGDLDISSLRPRTRTAVEEAISILDYSKRMGHSRLSPAFQCLLEPWESLCGAILQSELTSYLPISKDEQNYYFKPYVDNLSKPLASELMKHTINLKKNLIFGAHNNRIGNLLFCLSFGTSDRFLGLQVGGVWEDVPEAFSDSQYSSMLPVLTEMNDFRNQYIAHGEQVLTDLALAESAMRTWITGLKLLQGVLD